MVKLKLESFDKYHIVYSWYGIKILGSYITDDVAVFSFPVIDKYIDIRILDKYKILMYGEKKEKFAEKHAKEELEEVIEKVMDENNMQNLIYLLFEGFIKL